MRLLYNFSILLYVFAVRIASLFNPKAQLWLKGRKDIFEKLRAAIPAGDISLVWFHCASLGEFEQGRPLIELMRKKDPSVKILLTFFSPSGYEVRKNYAGADYIFYLPLDTTRNAKRFIDSVRPKAVFFVKYEFWFNYLRELKQRNIPVYLVSGIFRDDHHFFKSYGSWFRDQLNSFAHFYLQDERSQQLLNAIGFNNTTVCGDTRFDRVFEISQQVKQIDVVKQFAGDHKVLIMGSSWPEDEKIVQSPEVQRATLQDYKIIIAPHEIDEKHIAAIEAGFKNKEWCLRFSQANESNIKNANILIIDNIGMLSSLYQYGTVAFIGGGFGKGIHNILEAATFGLPVIFGPNYEKFTEAKELIRLGGAFEINNEEEFKKTITLLNDNEVLKTASHISKQYVQSRVGASEKILNSILPLNLPLRH